VTPYDPPQGMADLVRIVQAVSPSRAADLLALAFKECAADALLHDLRLRQAAPALLAACTRARSALERGHVVDWTELTTVIDQAEHPERAIV
jgi:hypothetical protein